MDDELFHCIQDQTGRERLRDALMDTYFPRYTPQSSENITRKYGPGDEGNEHKKLKEWIAQNPMELGITDVKSRKIEYVLPSGDAADIVFELDGNRYIVVEIETFDPYPGCYQALKYRVLKCAELGEDLKSSNVEAILVAWTIPEVVNTFCKKYGIRFVEKKL